MLMKSDMPCVGDENSLDLSPEHLRRLDVDGQEWKEKHSIEVKSSLLTSIHSSLKKTPSGMCQMWGSTQRERKENRTYQFKKFLNFVYHSTNYYIFH